MTNYYYYFYIIEMLRDTVNYDKTVIVKLKHYISAVDNASVL